MADQVHPLPPGKPVPSLGTVDALGSMLLHNTRPDSSGGFFATKWLMLVLPIVPVGRYYVRQGPITDDSTLLTTRTTTTYQIVGRSALRASEIARTYLFFWVALPAALVGPIVVSIYWYADPSSEMPQFYAMLIGVVLFFVVFLLLHLYRTRLRPVREPRFVGFDRHPTEPFPS